MKLSFFHVNRVKQDLVERKRYTDLKEKLAERKVTEKEKVFFIIILLHHSSFSHIFSAYVKIKNGKKPFFLKESAKKQMALDLRLVFVITLHSVQGTIIRINSFLALIL